MFEISVLFLLSISIELPILKIPVFIYFLLYRRIGNYEFLEPDEIALKILKNYILIYFSITYGFTFFTKNSPKDYFFTPFDLFYNFLAYGVILSDIFGKNFLTVMIAVLFQKYDNTPFLLALLDNYVLLYCNRVNFLFIKSGICLFNYVILAIMR